MTLLARWRCETCGGFEVVPAATAERGYFCCFASMTYLGVDIPRDSDAMLGTKPEGLSPEGVAARAVRHRPDPRTIQQDQPHAQ